MRDTITIIAPIWGVFTLGYDKIAYIGSGNIKNEIVYLSVFPFVLCVITVIVALIVILLLSWRRKSNLLDYPNKLVKLSEKIGEHYFLEALRIIEHLGITIGKYKFRTGRKGY